MRKEGRVASNILELAWPSEELGHISLLDKKNLTKYQLQERLP